MTDRPAITLALFNESRTERLDVDINSRITAVTVKTAINRGYDDLSIGIAPPAEQQVDGVTYGQLPEPLDLREFARAELRIGGYLAFEGRLGPVSVPATQLVIHGHWKSLYGDDWFGSSSDTVTTSGEIIKAALAASLIPIRPADGDDYQDPLSEHAPVEFDGRSIGDTLVQMASEGDVFGNSVDWYVWEDRRLHLKSRMIPETPDYRMPIDPATMTIIEDKSVRVTRLTVEFRAVASGTATITSGNTSVTVTHGLGITPAVEQIRINTTSDLGAGAGWFVDSITDTTFDINLVQEESNSGTATVTSGNTFVTVTHGLSRTPLADELVITPDQAATNDPGNWWVSNIGASSFRVNVRNDPGASGFRIRWRGRYQDVKEASDPGTAGASFSWAVEAGIQRTSEATNLALEEEIGRMIRRKVNVGSMTLVAAQRIRDRLLDALSRSRYAARVRIGPDGHLTGPHGEILSKEEARSGAWGQIANLPTLLSVSTTYDATGEQLDISFGDPLPTMQEALKRLQQAEERRARNIQPDSGGVLS